MADLAFDVIDWITSAYGDEAVRATVGSLVISAGESDARHVITKVEDTIARTVRSHVNVPLVSLANWLVSNWWRLRWEARPAMVTSEWRAAHCLSGIGGDDAWPALEISSDGDFVRLHMDLESKPDVAAIRYLQSVRLDVPADKFEAAVERLLDTVEARLAATLPRYQVLSELRAELREEQSSPSLAKVCRWQALAGIDPGEAPEEWVKAAEGLVDDAGPKSGNEIMRVVPELDNGLQAASSVIESMKRSSTTLDLSWVKPTVAATGRELPWQRGVRLAREMRKRAGLGSGPLSNDKLSEMLSVPVPLPGEALKAAPLSGGFRNGVTHGRTKIVWPSARPANQRFFLARMIGAAHDLSPDDHVIPVTGKDSALQKVERAFAQEFLCPWAALDAFTNEHGLDEDALSDAAEHFQVSEWTVRSTLVNRGKIPRDRLPSAG